MVGTFYTHMFHDTFPVMGTHIPKESTYILALFRKKPSSTKRGRKLQCTPRIDSSFMHEVLERGFLLIEVKKDSNGYLYVRTNVLHTISNDLSSTYIGESCSK